MEKFLNYILQHGRVAVTSKAILDKLTEIVKIENEQISNDLYKLTNKELDKVLEKIEKTLSELKAKKEVH